MQSKEGNYEICGVLLTRAKAPHISAIEIMRGLTTMYSNVEYGDMARCECIANKERTTTYMCEVIQINAFNFNPHGRFQTSAAIR